MRVDSEHFCKKIADNCYREANNIMVSIAFGCACVTEGSDISTCDIEITCYLFLLSAPFAFSGWLHGQQRLHWLIGPCTGCSGREAQARLLCVQHSDDSSLCCTQMPLTYHVIFADMIVVSTAFRTIW